MGIRLWVFPLLLGAWACGGTHAFVPKAVDGKLVLPDTTRIDSALLKTSEADKFLSLWFIYLLDDPVHVSSEPWTLFIPKNSGLPKGGGFLEDREVTKKILMNHAVLGQVLDAKDPGKGPAPITLSGTPLIFTIDNVGPMVNGVRLTGEEHKLAEGVIYVIESSIPILDLGSNTRAPPTSTPPTSSSPTSISPLTHRFATFKPRLNRPSPLMRNSLRPQAQVAVIPENVEPVLGEDVILFEMEPGFEAESETGFAGEFGSGAVSVTEPTVHLRKTPPPSGSKPTQPSASKPTKATSGFSEFEGTELSPAKEKTFLESFLESLQTKRAHTGAEFLHHFMSSNVSDKFRDAGRYTALVPYDSAFYQYYPIDWGFNPFLVANFTRDVVLNHFLRGNIVLEDLPSLAELTTLGGRVIKFIRKGNKLLGNGVEVVFESETVLSRGRSYVVQDLFFVDYDRILELQSHHGDLETAPLLGNPWPTSQFLSHLFESLQQDERTSFFAEYLNLTNLAYLLPGHDENLDPLKYTAFIPLDGAIASNLLADDADPFLQDEVLREKLILNHLVKGRFYEDDLKEGTVLENLANNTITISKGTDGSLRVNDIPVIESQKYIYNLGVMYFIDGIMGVTQQDIIQSLEKYPALNLEPTKDFQPLPSLEPDNEPSTTPEPTTILAPRPSSTTTTPPTRKPTPNHRPFAFPRASTTRRTTTPSPIHTTPKVRFETRTEISISRRVNGGEVESVAGNATS